MRDMLNNLRLERHTEEKVAEMWCTPRCGTRQHCAAREEKIVVDLATSDRKLNASREGSKGRNYVIQKT